MSKKKYTYCNVLPGNYKNSYYYISDFDVKVDDYVVIPIRAENKEKVGWVLEVFECTEKDAPYPPQLTKRILRKFGDNESSSLLTEKCWLEAEKTARLKQEEQIEKLEIKLELQRNSVEKDKIHSSKDKIQHIIQELPEEVKKLFNDSNKSFNKFKLSEDGKTVVAYKEKSRRYNRIIRIPDGVETIEDNVFLDVQFDYLYIPSSLKNIGFFTLYAKDGGLTEGYKTKIVKKILVEYDNQYYATDEQGFYALIDGKKQLQLLYDKSIKEYVTPDDVVSFAPMSFYGCKELKKIILSECMEVFNEYAIPYISQVEEVYISSSVRKFIARSRELIHLDAKYRIHEDNQWLFYDDDSVYEVLEDGTYKLLRNTYFGIGSVFILDNTSEIARGVFKGYGNLKNIELPKSLKIIGKESFAYSGLKKIVIPDGIKRIEESAFEGCYYLKSVKLPAGVEYIDPKAFSICTNLTKVEFSDNKYKFDLETGLIEEVTNLSGNSKSKSIMYLKKDMFLEFARKIVKCVQEESIFDNERREDRASFDQEKRVIKIKTLINQRCESEKLVKERIDSAEYVKIGESVNINIDGDNWEVILSGGKSLGQLDISIGMCAIPYLRHVFIDSAIIADIIPKSRRRGNAKYALAWVELEISECKLPVDLSEQDEKLMKEFSYMIDENEARLIRWIGKASKKNVVIPATLEGKTVSTLSSRLFEPYTFEDENNIQEIIISEGIKRIEKSALYHLGKLKRVEFPASVTYISAGVFADESGKNRDIYLKEGTVYIAPAGSYAETFLKKYKPSPYTVDKLIVVNDDSKKSQQKIKLMGLFDFDKMTSGVKVRFKHIFSQTVAAGKIISIPEAIDDVPVVSFDLEGIPYCIEQLNIPASVSKLWSISDRWLFYGCDKRIKYIEIAEDNKTYWSDGYAIFSKDKKKLIRFMSFSKKKYIVPEGVEILEEASFANMQKLESLILPRSVKNIKKDAFSNCDKLSDIQGMENITEYDSDVFGSNSYICGVPYLKNKEVIIIGNALVKYNILSEKIIKVPEGITKICSYAFGWDNDNDQVEEIILPEGLEYIEYGAFAGRKFLKKIIIPDGVKEIPPFVFSNCSGLETIYIPASIEKISLDALNVYTSYSLGKDYKECLKSIEVDPNNKVYCSVDGMLLSKDMTKLIYVPNNIHGDGMELVMPNGIKTIGRGACRYCSNLTKVILPSSLEYIEDSAFYYCKKLKKVVWSNNLKTIGNYAFSGVGLKIISLPEGIEHIGEEAFAQVSTKSVELPKSVRTLGWGAFSCIPEITVYDSIDPDAKPMDSMIDIISGRPNSMVGYIGMGPARAMWECAANHVWVDYTIIVKSAETEDIKYKVWMGADKTQREYYCFLSSAWGNNATFAFKELDARFHKIRGKHHKIQVAKYRLEYPYDLSVEAKEKYEKFLKNNT